MPNRSVYRLQLLSFLRQRRAACQRGKVEGASDKLMKIDELLKAFDLIRDTNDWRQLREIYSQQSEIRQLLPRKTGRHARVRERILQIITHANAVASVPRGYQPSLFQPSFQTKQ